MPYLNCIIVDDNELDRLLAEAYVNKCSQLKIAGIFENAESAYDFAIGNQIDVAFLDIELPGKSGIDLRKIINQVPACVFISSHLESASETFLLEDTIDFIVKPYNFDRFQMAVNRMDRYFDLRAKATLYEESIGGDAIYIKSGFNQIKIRKHEILYLEALKNYTIIHTSENQHSVLKGFSDFLNEDAFQNFLRIHRSFAVSKDNIEKITAQEVYLITGKKLPIGRQFKNQIKQ